MPWKSVNGRDLKEATRNFFPLNTDIIGTGKQSKKEEQIPSTLLVHSLDLEMPFTLLLSEISARLRHQVPTSHCEHTAMERENTAVTPRDSSTHFSSNFTSTLKVS